MAYDFCGWATKNDITCSDGRIIRKNAFKGNDHTTVPLVWNHQHNGPSNVLGHALLENREEGVYAYCTLNDTENGTLAKALVKHGDVSSLSIFANKLKQTGPNVNHGIIREVSLVLAGANPGAYIDVPIAHGEEMEDALEICYGIPIDDPDDIEHNDYEDDDPDVMVHAENKPKDVKERTVEDVINEMTKEQKTVLYALIGSAIEHTKKEINGGKDMKHNVFDATENQYEDDILAHSDQVSIIENAKTNAGNLQAAIKDFCGDDDELAHGFETIGDLFPEYHDMTTGAPELVTRDMSWVDHVMNGVHKSPFARIRTKRMDMRDPALTSFGYKTGSKKKNMGNLKLLKRTTDPQTVYIKDELNRDDILDITDFDVVQYQYKIMRTLLNEVLACSILIGDGRTDESPDKIDEVHIRPIWTDDELYTIHADIDLAAAKKELQGTATDVNFGDNYIFAESVVTASLYAREKYKGKGQLDFYCTPHVLNRMLLARDRNGRRIYSSKSDLAAALNVNKIIPVEQFEGKVRTDNERAKHNLLGMFVNLNAYHVGSVKGGQISSFHNFNIDFNKEQYLIETRLSGALTEIASAIVLEEPQVSGSMEP